MPWSYQLTNERQIVEVVYSGNVTADELRESTSTLIQMEKQDGLNRFLIDTSNMVLDAALVDIYNLPAKQYTDEQADRNARLALIMASTPREKEAAQFYETACVNRGFDVKAFTERQQAFAWLASGLPSAGQDQDI